MKYQPAIYSLIVLSFAIYCLAFYVKVNGKYPFSEEDPEDPEDPDKSYKWMMVFCSLIIGVTIILAIKEKSPLSTGETIQAFAGGAAVLAGIVTAWKCDDSISLGLINLTAILTAVSLERS